jgi:plasmid stabilization system protein ParE
MRSYTLTVRDEAQGETEEIRAWYESKSPGLGDRFVDALEEAYKHIRGNPFYQVRKSIYRYAQIDGFPFYRIVYTLDEEMITVYQVRHTSRRGHPKFGP